MSDPTEDIIKREIAAARQILREDRLLAKLNKHFPDDPPPHDPKDGPPPPDPKDPPADPPKKRGIWWGEEKE